MDESRSAEITDEVDDDDAKMTLCRLTDSIGDRMRKKVFPAVQPEEVMGKSAQRFAMELLQYSIQIEAVELQPYLDQCYKDFRRNNPADESVSENVLRAMWARDTYYPLLLEFSFGKALDKHRFLHRMEGNLFVPMIPLASIEDETKLDGAKKCVGEMTEDMIRGF